MENQEQIDLPLLIIISSLGILILVFFIVFIVLLYQKRLIAHKSTLLSQEQEHQQKLLLTALEIAEKERQKIAANIHDDVGIILSVVKMNLSRIEKNLEKREVIHEIVTGSMDLINGSLQSVRNIYFNIVPRTFLELGLIKGLQEVCNQLNGAGAAKVTLNSSCTEPNMEKEKSMQIYQLIKEVLNNTVRHAKPQFIEIQISKSENTLLVHILHNGMAITTNEIVKLAEKSTGIGLKSILTRSELLHATVEFSKQNNGQAQVLISAKL